MSALHILRLIETQSLWKYKFDEKCVWAKGRVKMSVLHQFCELEELKFPGTFVGGFVKDEPQSLTQVKNLATALPDTNYMYVSQWLTKSVLTETRLNSASTIIMTLNILTPS